MLLLILTSTSSKPICTLHIPSFYRASRANAQPSVTPGSLAGRACGVVARVSCRHVAVKFHRKTTSAPRRIRYM
ncbi:unnamed protein product [Tilletia laevis]|uniref:Uncharacterized protein n=1 Tax=Tilletia laevis TaxID=157183 RepID=A0A9N8QFN8_9BASI|nr:unnamed protein product [Tilletia laevis]